MKRTVIAAAGAVALGVAIHATTLLAQTGTTGAGGAAAQPRSRIALLNLSHVIKQYKKFTTYQNELKTAVDPFQARDTDLKKRGEALAKEGQTATPEKRDQIEKQLKDLQRQIEDNKNDAQKILIKKQEEQLKTLYLDVYNVVQRVASAHGYDMVLHYNDAVDKTEYWSAPNIARKMQAGALMPMYYAAGIDISEYVITTLNQSAGSAAAAAPAGTAPR